MGPGGPGDGLAAKTPVRVSQNTGRSSGLRLVTRTLGPSAHATTCSSTQIAPAFRRSVRRLGHEVTVRPRTTAASMRVHGAWQIAATGLPAVDKLPTKPTASASF